MLIRDLAPDQEIHEPGFYRIPLARHHAQPCDGVSVTSGVLRTMETATPADVWAFHMLNPNRWPKAPTEAMRLGVAMALLVEGGEARLREAFGIIHHSRPRRPTPDQRVAYAEGRATDAGKASVEFWAPIEADPDGWIDESDMEELLMMGRVLAADPGAQVALGGAPEVTMATQDPETGLWLLARPDVVSFDGAVADYKRMATRGEPFTYRTVDRRITDHAYDMQLAFAAEVFEALTGGWPSQAAIVAQSSAVPYHVILREISEEDLRMGQFRNRRALRRFRECLDSGHWPGPGEDIGAYQRPEWLRTMLLEQMNMEMAE